MKLNFRSPSAAAIVAGASFLASAGHIVHVVSETNPIFFALAYPIGIDGLIYVGIRAMQKGQYGRGAVALLIGAVFSLAFNGHAEGAFTMPALMIAASMPVCMFAAFIIEHSGKDEEIEPETVEVVREVVKTVEVLPQLLPIVPFAPKPVAPKAPKAPRIERPISAAPVSPAAGRGRAIAWDVKKAVVLLADGRTNADVAETVGTDAKQIQRTKRIVRLITEDASRTDEDVKSMVNGVGAGLVAAVRAAMQEEK